MKIKLLLTIMSLNFIAQASDTATDQQSVKSQTNFCFDNKPHSFLGWAVAQQQFLKSFIFIKQEKEERKRQAKEIAAFRQSNHRNVSNLVVLTLNDPNLTDAEIMKQADEQISQTKNRKA